MFKLEERIEITNKILTITRELLKNVSSNPRLNGLYVFIFHWLILGVPLIKIMLGSLDEWFLVSCIIWMMIFIFHVYFNGCILTRLERKLWDTKDWYGPWCLPFKFIEIYTNKKITRNFANTTFYGWGLFLIFYVIMKISFLKVLNKKN